MNNTPKLFPSGWTVTFLWINIVLITFAFAYMFHTQDPIGVGVCGIWLGMSVSAAIFETNRGL